MKELSLDELKAARLEILKAVDRFCVDNDIKYFLAYGTLLGAVRDGGFVPEEDGIDIMMPRPGYDIFCKGWLGGSQHAEHSGLLYRLCKGPGYRKDCRPYSDTLGF